MKPQRRELLAEGISQKISPPLVSKPQIQALAREVFAECAKKMVADEKKGRKTVQWATIQMKCRFCMYDLCVCVLQLKKKKEKMKNGEK